jgi:hypothetical protein
MLPLFKPVSDSCSQSLFLQNKREWMQNKTAKPWWSCESHCLTLCQRNSVPPQGQGWSVTCSAAQISVACPDEWRRLLGEQCHREENHISSLQGLFPFLSLSCPQSSLYCVCYQYHRSPKRDMDGHVFSPSNHCQPRG